jgi:DNA topoisomerase III
VNVMIPYPNGEEFQATGLMVLERNWLDVYSKWEKWNGNKVASFQIGETFTPQRMEMTAGNPLPPLTSSDVNSQEPQPLHLC